MNTYIVSDQETVDVFRVVVDRESALLGNRSNNSELRNEVEIDSTQKRQVSPQEVLELGSSGKLCLGRQPGLLLSIESV